MLTVGVTIIVQHEIGVVSRFTLV